MAFTPWDFIVDSGIISVPLLPGKLLRAKISFIQKPFPTPSLASLAFITGYGWVA